MEFTNNNVDNSIRKMNFTLQDSRTYLANDIEQPTWWQRRTRMEKRMVLGVSFVTLTCLAFLIAVVVLATKAYTEQEITNLIRSSVKSPDTNANSNGQLCTTPGCLSAASQIMQSMDTKVDPCEDFYRFSCGNWIRRHTIPEDKSNVNLFGETNDELMKELRNEIEKPKTSAEGHAIHTTKDIYAACMNEAVADSLGMKSFRQWVTDLGGWPIVTDNWDGSQFDWQKINLELMYEGSEYFFAADPSVDIKNNTVNILYIGIASANLQAEYLINQRKYPIIINAYKTQIRTIAQLVSQTNNFVVNETDIDDIIAFETMLANVTNSAILKLGGLENLDKLYNKITIREINQITKKFDWLQFLNKLYVDVRNLTENDMAIVSLPSSLPDFFDNLEKFDNRTIANYLIWRYTLKYVWHINNQTREASFQYQKVVTGAESQPARWLACVSIVNDLLGEVMGSIYAREFVPKDTKPKAEEMIDDLRLTVEKMLDKNEWMDKPTLNKAKIKAAAMIEFVAYPDWAFNDTYLDDMYEDLSATPVDIENYRQIMRVTGQYSLEVLDKKVERNTWVTSASTVNAFYSPAKNAILFPAGILQPPFFSPTNLKAMNYGAIGSVIGHEITHGFDNEGRQNDETGSLSDWWTNASAKAYEVKATCIRNQYAAYCNEELQATLNLTKTPCVDGNNTLSENIADNGGLKVALLIWCGNSRPQKQYQTLLYDVHSPDYFRVRGVLSNSEDFSKVFQCPPNSTMNPASKCTFW